MNNTIFPASKKRILCVEDDGDTCEILSLVLREYEFTYVHTIEHAEQKMQNGKEFDLYILDNRLPDGSGIELCRKIRNTDDRVPIIITSADGFNKDIDGGFDSGASRYMVKPYEPFALERLVKELLEQNSVFSG